MASLPITHDRFNPKLNLIAYAEVKGYGLSKI
jgi:hypothetical protein